MVQVGNVSTPEARVALAKTAVSRISEFGAGDLACLVIGLAGRVRTQCNTSTAACDKAVLMACIQIHKCDVSGLLDAAARCCAADLRQQSFTYALCAAAVTRVGSYTGTEAATMLGYLRKLRVLRREEDKLFVM